MSSSYPNLGVAGSNTSSNGGGCHGFLPSSAPVSSLLPPIPESHDHHNPLAALSSVLTATVASSSSSALHQQLAALLQGSVTPVSLLPPQQSHQQQPLPSAPVPVVPPKHQQLSHPQLLALSQVQQASWSLDQLEQHVSLLQRLQQPIPPNTALLLADARNRAQKRHAKRMANRQSACTSRARKKELVREMTELNTRLRRQALILSLLPDMVIAMDPQGTITFCSAQVERVVRRSIDHELIGANITDILEPGSQKELLKLVQQLLRGNKTVLPSGKGEGERKCKKHKTTGHNNSTSGKGDTISDNLLLEKKHPFPLQIVQMDAARSEENGDNSDASKQPPSSLTNSFALDINSGGSDNDNAVTITNIMTAATCKKKAPKANTATTSSDSSSTSEGGPPSRSPSTNPNRNLCLSANANLERNVRWHNKNRNAKHSGYKDDVNGAAVTANNASARLSSLQHMGSSSEEDDSGYRESNESREETSSSSEGESSAGEERRRVLAPTCNVCLIRKDLTTIWCEVTSSLRRKETTNQADCSSVTSTKKASHTSSSSASIHESSSKAGLRKRSAEDANLDEEENALEILLCLRPIHDGQSSSDKSSADDSKQQRIVSEVNTSSGGDDGATGEDSSDSKLGATGDSSDSMSSSHKRGRTGRDRKKTSSDNKNIHMDDVAVASLIAMSKSP